MAKKKSAKSGAKRTKPDAAKKKAAPKKAVKKKIAAKKAAKSAAPKRGAKSPAKTKSAEASSAKTSKLRVEKPFNMTSNEPLVGKGHRDAAVPAIDKKVATKTVAAGKKNIRVPVRTGAAGGRPGGGAPAELSPASDTAAGRGYGKKRKQR